MPEPAYRLRGGRHASSWVMGGVRPCTAKAILWNPTHYGWAPQHQRHHAVAAKRRREREKEKEVKEEEVEERSLPEPAYRLRGGGHLSS